MGGSDFLVMLETWEAANEFLAGDPPQKSEAIEIARLVFQTCSVSVQQVYQKYLK
jgi:hypothetical protein